jgi:hypothetical protein
MVSRDELPKKSSDSLRLFLEARTDAKYNELMGTELRLLARVLLDEANWNYAESRRLLTQCKSYALTWARELEKENNPDDQPWTVGLENEIRNTLESERGA